MALVINCVGVGAFTTHISETIFIGRLDCVVKLSSDARACVLVFCFIDLDILIFQSRVVTATCSGGAAAWAVAVACSPAPVADK